MGLDEGNGLEKSLLKWREPKAYVRMDFSHGRWSGLAAIFLTPAFLIGINAQLHGFNRPRLVEILGFSALGAVGFFGVILGSGRVVWLEQDCIATSGPYSYLNRVPYRRIESCKVCPSRYNGESFWVLRFAFKKYNLFTVSEVAVPQDFNLNQILETFRKFGVTVIEE